MAERLPHIRRLSFRSANMLSNLRFMLPAISVAVFHKVLDALTSIHGLQCVEEWLPRNDQIEEIGIDAAAVFSWKVRIDGAEPLILHHRFDHHLAQYPLERWPLIFVIAIPKQPIPHIKPNKVYDFVYSTADSASFAVQIESVVAQQDSD